MSLFNSARQHRGDELGNLLEFYRPYLHRLAQGQIESDLRPRFSASDAVQQTMLAAATGFETFQGTSERDFRKWIISILQNQVMDGRRFHRQAGRRDVRKQELLDSDIAAEVAVETPATSDSSESIDQLLTAIENLPPELQVIVRSRYMEGRSFDQIAQDHQVSRETARRRWKDAVYQLGKLLRSDDE